MQIQDFLGIGFVGVALSLFMEWLKTKYGPNANTTKFLVLALSLVVGSLYVLFQGTPVFQTTMIILGASSTVYAFLFH